MRRLFISLQSSFSTQLLLFITILFLMRLSRQLLASKHPYIKKYVCRNIIENCWPLNRAQGQINMLCSLPPPPYKSLYSSQQELKYPDHLYILLSIDEICQKLVTHSRHTRTISKHHLSAPMQHSITHQKETFQTYNSNLLLPPHLIPCCTHALLDSVRRKITHIIQQDRTAHKAEMTTKLRHIYKTI